MVKASRTNEKEVLEIRTLHADGMKICDVAKMFDHLSASSVGDIIRRRTWKHVEENLQTSENSASEDLQIPEKSASENLQTSEKSASEKVKPEPTLRRKATRSGMTEENALEIRRLNKEGESVLSLAIKFSVSRLVINCIINRHTFKHI